MSATPTVRLLATLTLILTIGVAAPASAQYFGQNKVQYRTFAFEVLKTEHFDIYYYPAERDGVVLAARMAERWHARLERLLAHRLRGRQPLVLYASHPHFEQTNIIGGELSEGTGGVTESIRRRIVLPLSGPLDDTDHVLGHEIVHAFQYDMTTTAENAPGENGASTLPLWFIEGMAEYLTLGPIDANTAMWLRDARGHDALPAIKDLDNVKYFPYRWGQAFWAYVGGRYGDRVIAEMLQTAAATDVDHAIERVLHVTPEQLSRAWQEAIRSSYGPTSLAPAPNKPGRVLAAGKPFVAEINVGPAVSPDGRLIAYLAQRNLFSIDLVVADAASGRIVQSLTRTASDPHYSSLQFIYSAGAWARDSRRLAVATVTSGQPALAIFDAVAGVRQREIVIPGVDEVLNPSWSPDGNAIAFSGMKQGLTDLFVYDLAAATLRQLTNDPYADLQPAWSPDGRRLAFVTDRFGADLKQLAVGQYRLAIIDASGGAVTEVSAFERGPHLDPQWSRDGRELYFVAGPDGIANVYRVSAGGGTATRLTSVGTGVSGITPLSPAMSVADDGTVVFSIYDNGKYEIRALDAPSALEPVEQLRESAAELPPVDRERSEVAALLANPEYGLPESQTYPSQTYRPRLSLEAMGQPVVSVGVSRFGPTYGGGVALYFGDMLEDHLLATALDVSSLSGSGLSAKDVAGEVAYVNRRHRWNWGMIGAQIPYLSGGYDTTVGRTSTGDVVASDRFIIFRQTEQSVSGITAYPFDRARRIELHAGLSHLSFDQIVTSTTYSLLTGGVYGTTTETRSLGRSLTLGTSTAAYVFDTSSFGATSPVRGQRYRIEAAPTFGSVNFTGLLADYRRYVMPVSFYTVAARVLHYGRYGAGGEDSRLYPLYVGYPELVRGYDINSIDPVECVTTATSSCALIDRLIGSRMLVGNLELRFPLLRPFVSSRRMYGPLPVEVALFADSGVAWNRGEKPSWLGGERDAASSAGVAFRINLLGFADMEVDMTRPFQRPRQGWTFGLNLLQGW